MCEIGLACLLRRMAAGLGITRWHQGAAVLPLPDDSYDTDSLVRK
jgi:hypothetical protein